MFLPNSFPAALALMLLGMVCWGSWANPYKLTRNWRFELFYFDYAIGIFGTSLVAALTLGTFFGSPTFLENLQTANRSALAYAILAGVVLNCGNVLLTAAMTLVGMATAFPVAVGLSFVMGTVLSYVVMPRGNPAFLFSGVFLVLIAVIVNAAAYRAASGVKVEAPRRGIGLCIAAGLLLSGFGPLVAKALSSPKPLAPYGSAVLFTFGALMSTFPLIGYLMRHPLKGGLLSLADYQSGAVSEHAAGWMAGLIWGTGTVAAFIAANTAGMALSGAIGQANPLVAALWGLFVWREFAGAPPRARKLLAVMFGLYIGGLALLAMSYGYSA
jgi:glucose uptake protein